MVAAPARPPPTVPPTWWSSCSTTSGTPSSVATARISPPPRSTGWPPTGCGTRTSTPPPCAPRPGPRCLTGRNHHTNGMGRIVETATGFPGYDATVPKDSGFLSEILLRNGYATFAVGKWHLAPAGEMAMGGPKDKWPLGRGFERFYGFLGGETDQFHPDLVYDNHQIDPPRSPERGLSPDRGSGRPGDAVHQGSAGRGPDQALLPVVHPGGVPRPPPRSGRVHRSLPRPVRPRLGRLARRGLRPPGLSSLLPPGTATERAPELGPGLGLAERRREAAVRAHDGGLRRLPDPHRRPGRTSSRLHRRPR